jgi:bacillithiol biosynthesis cysteine-adding enzyme BshC
MGSEDADLEELGTFRFGDRKFVWDAAGQTGAVGRMKTASLAPLLQQLSAVLGPPGEFARELELLLHEAYLKHENISRATQYLVHSLFGKYGLLVLDPDDARLKRCFLPVMEEDLLSHTAEHLVGDTNEVLVASGYKAQAQPRNINLFYLKDNMRERIEQTDDCWLVLNTDIQWDKATLLEELHEHPERFSPNVMLRPLYQETILPNVAFIGGGAEVAYWLQLRSLFQHHKVFYPTILLRQSVMWMSAEQKRLMSKTGLSHESVFLPKDEAVKAYLVGRMDGGWQLPEEHDQLEVLLSTLREKATAIDPTLQRSADATLARMKHQLDALESKMLRAVKRKEHIAVSQIERLQQQLFPGGGLAERAENFMPYYLQHGPSFFEILLRCIRPLSAQFLIIESEH